MDEGLAILAMIGVLVLALLGILFLCMDYRHFDQIVKQCETQGYVQNATVRIVCYNENKKP